MKRISHWDHAISTHYSSSLSRLFSPIHTLIEPLFLPTLFVKLRNFKIFQNFINGNSREHKVTVADLIRNSEVSRRY